MQFDEAFPNVRILVRWNGELTVRDVRLIGDKMDAYIARFGWIYPNRDYMWAILGVYVKGQLIHSYGSGSGFFEALLAPHVGNKLYCFDTFQSSRAKALYHSTYRCDMEIGACIASQDVGIHMFIWPAVSNAAYRTLHRILSTQTEHIRHFVVVGDPSQTANPAFYQLLETCTEIVCCMNSWEIGLTHDAKFWIMKECKYVAVPAIQLDESSEKITMPDFSKDCELSIVDPIAEDCSELDAILGLV